MTVAEDRVRYLLHRVTPQPPGEITADQVITAAERRHEAVLPLERGARTRRRPARWAPLLAAAAVLLVAAVLAVSNRGQHHGQPAVGPGAATHGTSTSTGRPSAGPSSTSSTTADAGGACIGTQLSASIARRGSTASAPFLVVALRNTSPTGCTLNGYPTLALYPVGSSAPLPVTVEHGTYELPDPGPATVPLSSGGVASFALGTSTAYSGGLNATVVRVAIGVPGAAQKPITLTIPGGLGATASQGKALPVGITAFAAVSGS
jgi:hypothetical protein